MLRYYVAKKKIRPELQSRKALNRLRTTSAISAVVAISGLALTSPASATSTEARIQLLEQTIQELLKRESEKERTIEALQSQVEGLQAGYRGRAEDIKPAPGQTDAHQHHAHGTPATSPTPASTTASSHEQHGDSHAHDHGEATTPPDLYSVDMGSTRLRLKNISADVAIAGGGSSESGETLENLEGGDHDPRQNGFTFQTLDFSMQGALDPYVDASLAISFFLDTEGETKVELEEAFLQTQSGVIPYGFDLKAGQMFSNFGLFNTQHFHDWGWLDAPFMNTRLFGADNLRNPGFQVGWHYPFQSGRFNLSASVQNSGGETASSFLANDETYEERPIGGRPFTDRDVTSAGDLLWLAHAGTHLDVSDDTNVKFGVSGGFGPNATGRNANTVIAGFDLSARTQLSDSQFLHWQSEFLYRNFEASANDEVTQPDGSSVSKNTLEDYGLYSQVTWGFAPEWSFGLRGEYGTGSGQSIEYVNDDGDTVGFDGRGNDPFRDNRYRLSPLLTWHFLPGARLRAQFNYDNADHLVGNSAYTGWLGLEWSIGAGSFVHGNGAGHSHDHQARRFNLSNL